MHQTKTTDIILSVMHYTNLGGGGGGGGGGALALSTPLQMCISMHYTKYWGSLRLLVIERI